MKGLICLHGLNCLKAALVRLFWQRCCWWWLMRSWIDLNLHCFLFSLVSVQFKYQHPSKEEAWATITTTATKTAKKINRLGKQKLCWCTTLFCTFLRRRCMTATWKCLILRFVEDGNARQRLSFSFPELWYCLLEFNFRKIWQDLTNWPKME